MATIDRPMIARGDLRQCLTALAEMAEQRAENDPDPNRRQTHRRLLQYLTRRLARVIVRNLDCE